MKLYEILDGNRKEKNFSCIYKWTNLVNGKVYIGQTQNFYNRMVRYHTRGATPKLQNSIEKHGIDSFDIEIVELCDIEHLDEREQYWMDYYCSYQPEYGYNISPTAGTTRGVKYSPEVCEKISKIVKERAVHLYGEKNGMYGKHHTEETLKKISEHTKQMWEDPEYRQMQSERMSGENNYFYGKHFCGELNPRYGVHCTDETKEKIRQALLGKPNLACSMKVRCVETGEEFYSMTAAAKAYNTYASAIKLAVDNPDRRTCKGYHWEKV